MAEATIICELVYVKSECDLSVCEACKDTIYTQNNLIGVNINDKFQSLNIKLCDSCYDVVKK